MSSMSVMSPSHAREIASCLRSCQRQWSIFAIARAPTGGGERVTVDLEDAGSFLAAGEALDDLLGANGGQQEPPLAVLRHRSQIAPTAGS